MKISLFKRFGFIVTVLLSIIVISGDQDVEADQGEQTRAADTISDPAILSPKTMSRAQDFIVVPGRDLTSNLNKKIDRVSLFAAINGAVQPIPFQIDEINKDGKWVLPNLPPSAKVKKRNIINDEDNGRIDENDELVFLIRDVGSRISKDFYPEGAISTDEIKLEDEIDGGLAWVYLCSFSSSPPLSDVDYIDYDLERDRIVSPAFDLGFSKIVPSSYDFISYKGSENIFDTMKLRFSIKLFGIKMNFDETDFSSTLFAYKDGPVRVIRQCRMAVYINRFLKTPSGSSTTVYYDNAVAIPFTMKFPVSPATFKKIIKIKMRGGCDMQKMHGWKVKNNIDPRELLVDGKMDELEQNVKGSGSNWIVAGGPEWGMLIRMILDRTRDGSPQELPLQTDFFYVDDDLLPDPPEFVPGQSPNIGFLMSKMEALEKGTYFFYLLIHIIDESYQNGIEEEYLNIMNRPIRTEVL